MDIPVFVNKKKFNNKLKYWKKYFSLYGGSSSETGRKQLH